MSELEKLKDNDTGFESRPSKDSGIHSELGVGLTENMGSAEIRGSFVATTPEMRPVSSVDSLLRGAEARSEGYDTFFFLLFNFIEKSNGRNYWNRKFEVKNVNTAFTFSVNLRFC